MKISKKIPNSTLISPLLELISDWNVLLKLSLNPTYSRPLKRLFHIQSISNALPIKFEQGSFKNIKKYSPTHFLHIFTILNIWLHCVCAGNWIILQRKGSKISDYVFQMCYFIIFLFTCVMQQCAIRRVSEFKFVLNYVLKLEDTIIKIYGGLFWNLVRNSVPTVIITVLLFLWIWQLVNLKIIVFSGNDILTIISVIYCNSNSHHLAEYMLTI